jgi:signal transduction histidine kinase
MERFAKYPDREALTEEVVKQKLHTAESYSAIVRLAVVVINAVAFVFLIDKSQTIPGLAWPILISSLVYSFYVAIWEPFRKYPIKRTSYLTSAADSIFILLWIMSTGMASSPFFLLWYISIIAFAQRFSFRATLFTSVVYAAAYMAVLRIDIGYITTADMFLRVLYIPIAGILSAFFSREFEAQVGDKLRAMRSESKALSAKRKQKELLKELQTIRDGLEVTVQQRTSELQQLNTDLRLEMQEREAAQRAQRQLVESLSRINAELESFAYVTSHDLKTPLRGIATIADWLLEDYADSLDKTGHDNLHLMKKRVQRMNDLIDGILRYSRAGRASDETESIDMAELVNDCVGVLQVPESTTVIVGGEFPTVIANRTLVLQVIENLLGNAVKYADPVKGDVRITGKAWAGEWEIAVYNNGPGIAKEHHDRIFEIFQTLHNGDDAQSTGVGLTIVKKVIAAWGGLIRVDSDGKKDGTTFTFTIPGRMLVEEETKASGKRKRAKVVDTRISK